MLSMNTAIYPIVRNDYNDWIMEKAMDEYLSDYVDNWIEDNHDEDEYIKDFMDSGDGPQKKQ